MRAKTTASSSGIGLGGMLTVLFIGLKLCNQINWSWWWVLSPLWIPLAVILALCLIFGVAMVIQEMLK